MEESKDLTEVKLNATFTKEEGVSEDIKVESQSLDNVVEHASDTSDDEQAFEGELSE